MLNSQLMRSQTMLADADNQETYQPLMDYDKSNFVCIKLKNSSFYYGEVIYVDQQNKEVDVTQIKEQKEEVDDEGNAIDPLKNYRRVRHGMGVQINDTSELDFKTRYEGQWNLGNPHGQGKYTFEDRSTYTGQIKHDKRQGKGKYQWKNGCVYDGSWRNDRMEGTGVFTNMSDVFTGTFKNNYFYKNGQFVNPFIAESKHKDLLLFKKKQQMLRETVNNENLFIFKRHNDLKKMYQTIYQANQHNRIALIISTKQFDCSIQDFQRDLTEATGKKIYQFDLRQCFVNSEKRNVIKEYHNKIKEQLAFCLAAGQIFIINMDDSPVEFNEIYDPKIQEFYSANHFPSQIFDYQEMKKPQVYQRVLKDTKYEGREVAKNVTFMIWSKYSVSELEEDNKIVEKCEHRFQNILPFAKIDVVLYTKQKQQSNIRTTEPSGSKIVQNMQEEDNK